MVSVPTAGSVQPCAYVATMTKKTKRVTEKRWGWLTPLSLEVASKSTGKKAAYALAAGDKVVRVELTYEVPRD